MPWVPDPILLPQMCLRCPFSAKGCSFSSFSAAATEKHSAEKRGEQQLDWLTPGDGKENFTEGESSPL